MKSKFSLIGVNIKTMVVETIATISIKNADYIRGNNELCIVMTKPEAKNLWTKKISLQKVVELNKLSKRANYNTSKQPNH